MGSVKRIMCLRLQKGIVFRRMKLLRLYALVFLQSVSRTEQRKNNIYTIIYIYDVLETRQIYKSAVTSHCRMMGPIQNESHFTSDSFLLKSKFNSTAEQWWKPKVLFHCVLSRPFPLWMFVCVSKPQDAIHSKCLRERCCHEIIINYSDSRGVSLL